MAYRSEADWQQLIAEQQQSGLSQQAFCDAHGISAKYFSLRKTRLLAEGKAPAIAPRFVKATTPSQRSMVRVHYQGVMIEFAGSVSELAALVRQLA